MAIHYLDGDIFASECQTFVNPINCVGTMGKGLALGFKSRFPKMYSDYVRKCRLNEVRIGMPYLYRDGLKWLLNFPTKDHWRRPSTLPILTAGLAYVVDFYRSWGAESIAFPALGCGNGELDWAEVRPLMGKFLECLDIPVEIYLPK